MVTPETAQPAVQVAVAVPNATAVVPTSRPRRLKGETFQIKEEGNHRTYCTLNYIEVDGVKKPWEIFLSSSSRHSEWYAAIGRLASRIMRKTGDVQAVIDELMEIGSEAGYLTQEYGYVTSKPMHIAKIIEEFVNGLNEVAAEEAEATGTECPNCGELTYRKEGGCSKCSDCGFSTCG